jgi:hypothetical protein
MRILRSSTLAAAGTVAMLIATHVGAAAATDPYAGAGYDYSYLQCGVAAPAAQSFGIVGVNAGYPFTYYNSCLGSEYGDAAQTGSVSLYVNTGYDPSYTSIDGRHTTQDCANASSSIVATPDQQAAWAVGCSEAERDVSYATSQGAAAPIAWWLDVETANSWSTTDLSLNRYTLQGLITELGALASAPIGVYSTSSQWSAITGGYQPPVSATWVATGMHSAKRAMTDCTSASFTGAPIWLVQYVGTIDHDLAC